MVQINVYLDEQENKILSELSKKKEISKVDLIKLAIRNLNTNPSKKSEVKNDRQ
jgi:hypothetical protein